MADSNALTCKELVEIITDYLEGKLPPAEVKRFDTHLSDCEGCKHYLAQMGKTVKLVGTLSEDAITEPVKSELLTAFRAWKQTKQKHND